MPDHLGDDMRKVKSEEEKEEKEIKRKAFEHSTPFFVHAISLLKMQTSMFVFDNIFSLCIVIY